MLHTALTALGRMKWESGGICPSLQNSLEGWNAKKLTTTCRTRPKKLTTVCRTRPEKGWCVRLSCSEQWNCWDTSGCFLYLECPALTAAGESVLFSEQKCCSRSLQERRDSISQILLCIHGQDWCWKLLSPSENSQCLYCCLSTIPDSASPDLCSLSCPALWTNTAHAPGQSFCAHVKMCRLETKTNHKTEDPMKWPPHAGSTKLPECERMPRSLSVSS